MLKLLHNAKLLSLVNVEIT